MFCYVLKSEHYFSKVSGLFSLLFFSFISFSLAQTDTIQQGALDEITIHFSHPTLSTAGNTTTITLSQIEKQQGNGSVNNMLELMPAMVTTSDAGTGLGYTYMRLRGIDQTRINTTLNGITINDAESQGSWLVNLPDMGNYLQEVSVQSGANTTPGTISYGARLDFKTRNIPTRPFAEVGSAFGSFNTLRNAVSAGTGWLHQRFALLASFSNIRSDGFIDRSNVQLNSVFLSAKYRLLSYKQPNKEYGTLQFHLLHGAEHSGLAWNGVPYDSLATNRTYNSCGEYYSHDGKRHYYDNEKDHYTQTRYQLEYEKLWNNKDFTFENRLYISTHLTRGLGYYQEYKDDKDPVKYGLTPLYSESTADFITQKFLDNYFYGIHIDYSGSTHFSKRNTHRLNWCAGIDVDPFQGLHYGKIIWTEPNAIISLPVDYTWYQGTGNKLQSKLFGTLQYVIKNFSIRVELQYRRIDYRIGGYDDLLKNINQQYLWNFYNPKMALHYMLKDKKDLQQHLDFSFSTANREPTRSDILDAPDAKKPVPETLYDIELSYKLSYKKLHFNAIAYGMYYRNQLVLTGEINDVGAAIMTNVDKSFRTGIELSMAYQPFAFFTWHINGCFSHNQILDYVNYVDDWNSGGQIMESLGTTPISFSPNVVLGNNFTFTPIKNMDISIATKFVSKQYLDNSGNNNCIIKPYSYTNLQINYTFEFKRYVQKINLYAHINNIFNAKYSSNAWLYSYYYNNIKQYDSGYFPQAGIHFLIGAKIRF